MAFRKKVDFLQVERDELPHLRPAIIYVVAAVDPSDHSTHTAQYKHFEADASLPAGILKREGNPYRFCLIEASSDPDQFDRQLTASLDSYKDASYKLLVINTHGAPDGIVLKNEGDTKVSVSGAHFATVVAAHTHGKHLQVLVFAAHGHSFASEFYTYIMRETEKEVRTVLAITNFTSAAKPTAYDRPATSGNAHVEVKRDIRRVIKEHVDPNNPYKKLDKI